MYRRRLSASIFALLLASAPAFAEPATSEGAKTLGESFAAYFGRSAVEQGIIAVTPQGDDYKVSIDLQRAIDGLGIPGGGIKLDAFSFLTTPQQGGAWKVAADAFPNASLHLSIPDGDYDGSLMMRGFKFAGVYDPKLAAFVNASNTIDAIDVRWTAKDADVSLEEAGYVLEMQSSEADGGAVNSKFHHALKSVLETVKVAPNGKTPMNVVYKVGPITSDGTAEGVRSRSMLDLWAFLVGLGGIEKAADHQDELKSRLNALLPLWTSSKVAASIDGVSVQMPFGQVSVKSFGERVAVTGIAPHGEFEIGLKIDGLTLPTALLPSWSVPLLPDLLDANVKFSADGLDQIAKTAIAEADFRDDPPLSEDSQDKLAGMWRSANPRVTIQPSRMTSPNYALAVQGEFALSGAKPTGHVTIEAQGFDKSVAVVQAAAQSNPQLQQVLAALTIAKGLAKTGADGKLTWDIALAEGGAVTINGQSIGK
jgi:hypothetical protein